MFRRPRYAADEHQYVTAQSLSGGVPDPAQSLGGSMTDAAQRLGGTATVPVTPVPCPTTTIP